MVRYSEEMKAYMDAHDIDPKWVCYLTIAREPLQRIISGKKTVEFRDLSDFYCRKLFLIEDGVVEDPKPFTHLLFQGGYSADSPRVLVEFEDAGIKLEGRAEPYPGLGERMDAEAAIEGFDPEDAWIGIALGKVCFTENAESLL